MKNKQPDGVWVEKYVLDSIKNIRYKSREVYRLGNPVRTWKYYKNGKIERKEKYKKQFCLVTYYYENGKIEKRGKTKQALEDKKLHWFYDGDWYYYTEKGNLTKVISYQKGQVIKVDTVRYN